MSDRTGLGPLEVALLRTVEALADRAPVRTTAALDRLESNEHFGAVYAVRAMQHLGAPWCVHLRLLDLHGNWGSAAGDPMADPAYTEVGLSWLGRLVLAAERGAVGRCRSAWSTGRCIAVAGCRRCTPPAYSGCFGGWWAAGPRSRGPRQPGFPAHRRDRHRGPTRVV